MAELKNGYEFSVLSARARNALERVGITNFTQLTFCTERMVRNISKLGETSFEEISEELQRRGLSFQPAPQEFDVFSPRVRNILRKIGVLSFAQLTTLTESEIRGIRNLGEKLFEEITDELQNRGLSLRQ